MKIQVVYGRRDVAEVKRCPRCKGTGNEFGQDCPYCKGSGERISRTYTYQAKESVEVGDIVLTPGNWLRAEDQEATVVALGSDYEGDADTILRVLNRETS